MRGIVRAALAALCLLLFGLFGPPEADALPISAGLRPSTADVHGEDEKDRYVGTGGLLLPGGVGRDTRAEVAGCEGCQWRLTTPCVESSAGVAFPGQAVCQGVVRGCPQGDELLRTWFRQSGAPWREIGLICLGDQGPVTIRQIRQRVLDRFVADLPRIHVTTDPPRGVLAQLPVVFASGQDSGPLERHYALLGQPVTVHASPSWQWLFGDGGALGTREAGGAYPDMGVAHAYRRAGSLSVRVTTTWSAFFEVADLGPFPIVEPIEQFSAIQVTVGEGRAVLAVPR